VFRGTRVPLYVIAELIAQGSFGRRRKREWGTGDSGPPDQSGEPSYET